MRLFDNIKIGVVHVSSLLFSYPFSGGQVQVQQQLNPEEYAAMQERENAIAQLEVTETQGVYYTLTSILQRLFIFERKLITSIGLRFLVACSSIWISRI